LPGGLQADLIIETINEALEQDTSFSIVAVVGLAWSGMGLFSNITLSLDQIFQVPHYRSMWRQRLVAVAMIVILVVLITTSFVTSGVLWLVSNFLLTGGTLSSWVRIASVFLPFGLNIVIYVLVFRFVPARVVYWDAVWPAAVVGAVGWELAKAGFSWYLANLANYALVYGSIATVIVLLFWAYLVASIFLFSAELCAS
jgi:membrane protein